MKKGSSAGILLNPTHIVLVWNIKFISKAYELLSSRNHPFPDWLDHFEGWRKNRNLPWNIQRWVREELRRSGEQMVKGDKYGFGCGHIEHKDGKLAKVLEDVENYPHYTLMREFREEVGLKVAKEVNGIRQICFEFVGTIFETDFENPSLKYPTYFYWVKEAYGNLNKSGFEGETEAPELISIAGLYPGNFYPKHAFSLKVLLTRLVYEYGKREYRRALDHITLAFAKTHDAFAGKFEEAIIRSPELLLSDNEIWAKYVQGDDIVRMC